MANSIMSCGEKRVGWTLVDLKDPRITLGRHGQSSDQLGKYNLIVGEAGTAINGAIVGSTGPQTPVGYTNRRAAKY